MSQVAPDVPTIEDLEALFPFTVKAENRIERARASLGNLIRGRHSGLIAILGPCAMTGARNIIDREGHRLHQIQADNPGLLTLHRLPPWKPRTNPDDWHGHESEENTVVDAYGIVSKRAADTANLAIEIGHMTHIKRYGSRLTLGWLGGRNIDNTCLLRALASACPSLPVGVKNGLDGDLDTALRHVEYINTMRGPDEAPAILIYRGGDNARNPDDWEKSYRRALEMTDGQLIVDTAHGGEMAHDPAGNFQKSVVGQIACLDSVIRVAEEYVELPLGVMIEASDAPSPTDPVMPFASAIAGALKLHQLKAAM